MHATEFLASESGAPVVPVMVLFGSERSLKIDVLHRVPGCQASGDDDSDLSFSRVTGDEAQLTDVTDELLTVSMFGDRRVVMVEVGVV